MSDEIRFGGINGGSEALTFLFRATECWDQKTQRQLENKSCQTLFKRKASSRPKTLLPTNPPLNRLERNARKLRFTYSKMKETRRIPRRAGCVN